MTAGHRLRYEVAAHLPGGRRRDGLTEEEPYVGSVARTGAFNRGGKAHIPARGDERSHVFGPALLVEVDGQEPASLVCAEWIHAHDLPPSKVRQDGRVVDR